MPARPKNSLQDLAAVAKSLMDAKARAAVEEAARREKEKRLEAERNLFTRAAGAVRPLPARGHFEHPRDLPAPIPVQQQLDDQRVMQESLSDEFDFTTLLDIDDALSFRRPGIGADVTRRLRKGEWRIQREIDLHGLRSDEAREALGTFLRDVRKLGVRCIRVVHGKGLGSPGKSPVLKGKVQGWLIQKNEVLAFVQARPDEGGAGALVVLMRAG